jgi:hypothetical protein
MQKVFRGGGLCRPQYLQSESQRNQRRGSATQRGYDRDHRELFRAPVLEHDPICMVCGIEQGDHCRSLPPSDDRSDEKHVGQAASN